MGVGQLAFAIVAGHGEEGGTCPVDEGELAEELLDLVADAYDRLLQSRWGERHMHLGATPEEAVLAMMGEPVDCRPGWKALSVVLRGMVLNDVGVVGVC
jgi:hypothetical protein